MAFRVSPGVTVTEKDFTNVIPAVSTTKAAAVTMADWGPEEYRVLVANESELVNLYGKPNTNNYENWLNIANFLGYGASCTVARSTTSSSANAAFGHGDGVRIANRDIYDAGYTDSTASYGTFIASGASAEFFAKYPGSFGNSLRVAVVQGVAGTTYGYSSSIEGCCGAAAGATQMGFSGSSHPATGATAAIVGDTLKFNGDTTTYTVTTRAAGVKGLTLGFTPALNATIAASATGDWEFKYKSYVERPYTSSNLADLSGGTGDQFTIIVVDEDGDFGTAGEVLEVFNGVSQAKDARDGDGNSNFYQTVINANSKYIWAGNSHVNYGPAIAGGAGGVNSSINTGGGTGNVFANVTRTYSSGAGGAYGTTASDTEMLTSYNLFSDPDTVDVSLILTGGATASLSGNIIDIAEARKDCVAFVSPGKNDTVGVTTLSTQVANVKAFRNDALNKSSSYAFLDSGWKYMYDRHNDTLRWVPLNGDMAGLCARTDNVNDPWFSPAGFNRGQIRGAVKLSMNPTPEAHRDDLYVDSINPVVAFPGQGTLLFGDKTLQSKGSAFDRINVRRLFIVMEKAISTASKFQLFEQNDSFTRAQFKNMIEPFLRDIQGRRGITDFKVICDDTNNTSEVIDGNKFVADIFVKPTRSINFIQLNFVAARSGVDFSEIAGG
jgi:hypothetical protein